MDPMEGSVVGRQDRAPTEPDEVGAMWIRGIVSSGERRIILPSSLAIASISPVWLNATEVTSSAPSLGR
jgi:hypothetical protein